MFKMPPFLPLLIILVIVVGVVLVITASKKKQKNHGAVTSFPPPAGPCCAQCGRPMPAGAVFCAGCGAAVAASVPTQEERDKAEIAALSYEEVHRRYCDVNGRSDAYRYLCYEELERRKGKQ